MIKLVLIDIDGTLVRDDKTLPAENEEAIKEALQSGVLVTLVTGRNYGAAKEIIDKLQLDVPVVLQNGAFIYRPYSGEVIRKVGLTGDVAKRVIHLCRQEGTFYILYRDFLMQKDMLIDQDYDGPFSMYLKRNAVRLDRVEDVTSFISGEVAEVALLGNEDRILRVLRQLGDGDNFTVIKSLTREDEAFYEIFGPKVGKGEALNYLCQHFGVSPEEVMFIGDAYNDIDIMPLVGFPVAMGNAVEEVKKFAKAVTKSNNEGGVAWAIRHFVLSPKGDFTR
ncbi:MAG TPA: Cof-type HAD-IIB family hydrolase [Coprothermobacter proteolyticus]|uniref:Cof-type HAD-IIB family hydrolase n=1 Tax=Coprothermobacter proteolyticus TaxID=35786 RepID=UPI0002F86E39|nr:Cof-type HAD-IIB family hydrolase [Coprothermobacter proteolyticus]ACI17392.2 HAD family hydrolase [Coprothermobacter proteolyticus DSM 5265]HOA64913.1 Cof-type HAD-IIB family hydrolase [Coprothermobacter proteolyticus]